MKKLPKTNEIFKITILFPYSMKKDASRLFTLINSMLAKEKSPKEISDMIANDATLLSISNSYCMQCGYCCNEKVVGGDCSNKEARDDGKINCLLHCDSEDYPNGREIPQFEEAVANRLDPMKFAKPLCCHVYGPQHVILSWMEAEEKKDRGLIDCVKCPGGLKMLQEYHKFTGR